jgi:hypothetical protein
MSRQQRSSGDDWKIALEPASRYTKSAAPTLCSTAVSDAMHTAARYSSESEKPVYGGTPGGFHLADSRRRGRAYLRGRHVVFAISDGDDPDWASWYADWTGESVQPADGALGRDIFALSSCRERRENVGRTPHDTPSWLPYVGRHQKGH